MVSETTSTRFGKGVSTTPRTLWGRRILSSVAVVTLIAACDEESTGPDDDQPTVSWTAESQSSSESTASVTVTAQLSEAADETVTVPFTIGGTATTSSDFTASASPVTIAEGQTTGTVTITVVNDTNDEPDETVVLNMGTPTNATRGTRTVHTVTIQDNDEATPVTVSFSTATQSNQEGVATVTVTAQLSRAAAQAVTVPFTVSGTAVAPGDYTISSSSITIPAGQLSGSATISVVDDIADEQNETVVITMGAPTNATQGTTTVHTATIEDNDASSVTVGFTSATQTNAESVTPVMVTVQLSAPTGLPVTVPFTLSGGATSPADYTISASPITIAAGQTTGSAEVTVVNDALDEGDETIVVTMGTPVNAVASGTTIHGVTIQDNDPATATVTWSAATQSNAESVTSVTITAQLSAASGQAVSIPFTLSGTATTPGDFTTSANPLVIPAGQTTGSVTITVVNDAVVEPAETLIVTMGTPLNAAQGATTVHTATITDDDSAGTPTVSFTTLSQTKLENVTSVLVTAQLSAVSGQAVTVPFTIGAGNATSPADYTISVSPITIPAGQLSASATITVVDDAIDEPNETVVVHMGAPTNAMLGLNTVHVVTIEDNDAGPTVQWTAASQTNLESVAGVTVTAQLSAASAQTVTVPFTVTGTGLAPGDYTISASPITIPAGQTTGTATITVAEDVLDEANETVIVTIGTPTNATVGATAVHTATIEDNDAASATVTWVAASQSNLESVISVFVTAQLSAASGQAVTVPFTVTGTATNPADFTITASPITIPAGQLQATALITVVNDTADEPNETVIVTMGAPSNAAQGAVTVHTATIEDNDP